MHTHSPILTPTMNSQLRMLQQTSELQLRPLNVVMKRILDRLGRKDPANIFAEPVSLEEVSSLVPLHGLGMGLIKEVTLNRIGMVIVPC